MAKNSKNTAAAVKFLEYLSSPEAQNYFANGNNEGPTAKGVKVNNPALAAMSGGAGMLPVTGVLTGTTTMVMTLEAAGLPEAHR